MKILIAPHEISGQMQLLAEAFRQKGHMATAVCYAQPSSTSSMYVNDVNMGSNGRESRLWRGFKRGLFSAWAVSNYDVFHFFYGASLLRGGLDLPWLKRLGKKVLVHFRGSDIRENSFFEHKASSILGGSTPPHSPVQSLQQQRCLKRWRRYADVIMVSTPDLLRIVPEAELVQQAIDLSQWEYLLEPPDSNPQEIRILHAPTARHKKGTEFIIKAVEDLKSAGHFVSLVIVEGLPASEVKQIYQTCHIGVTQLLDGWYGNVSIEMMALGKPVVGYIDPELLHHRPDLPVVSATPFDLTEKLETLICDQPLRRRLGQQGRAYVEKWHDASRIADRLLELYQK